MSTPTLRLEASGYTASCECGWLRWLPSEKTLRGLAKAHEENCKGAPVKDQQAPTRSRGKTDWSGREGSTWIDQL